MKKQALVVLSCVAILGLANLASADTFGTGDNQFGIDFVTISGATNPTSGIPAGAEFTFTGVSNDYRMGVYEVTNGQWDKFKAELAPVAVTGDLATAYDEAPYWTGTNVPTNEVSWYEAAQFVNWLNTSTGHHAAYNFTGTQGTSGYALDTWTAAQADNGTNLYRHKDAIYYMPTENEWVKAAYWNGKVLLAYAVKRGDTLHPGDGASGTGWNYWGSGYADPWDVGTGSEELNGTFDMMGNVWEWMESPYSDTGYGDGSYYRGQRGGFYDGRVVTLASSYRYCSNPNLEHLYIGFRVASEVPEPATLSLLALGGLALLRRRK